MSDNSRTAGRRPDARALRSREALLDAFGGIVLSRPYEKIRVVDVLARARIGRSTFYEHFSDKDALLRASVAFPFSILAALAGDALRGEPGRSTQLDALLDHFWENRLRGARLFRGAAAPHVARALRDLIEAELARAGRGSAPQPAAVRLFATQLAWSQLGLLQAWLGEEIESPPAAIAAALREGAAAALASVRRR